MATTSLSNTPQAKDDLFTFAITGLTADSLSTVTLNVMANDLGGNAKSLYSLDDGTNTLSDLTTRDTTRIEATSIDYSAHGAHIWITADGKVSYDASTLDPAFVQQLQQLSAGQYLTDTFTYAIQLGNGTLSWATATVQIAASSQVNHPAVIGDPSVADVTEDLNAQSGNLTASGTISISDPDAGQNAFNTAVSGAQGNLGTLALQSDGHYTYSVANSAVQFLGVNDTHIDKFTVTSVDGTSKQVSFTIHGANDAAAIGDPTVHDVSEDVAVNGSGNLTTAGTISVSDLDQNQSSFQTAVSGVQGNLGTLALQSDGHYTYSVANNAVQFLGVNDTHIDTFTVTSVDGTSKQVSFSIHGAIDNPQVQLAPASGNAADASIPLSIQVTDVDLSGAAGNVDITGVPSSYSLSKGVQVDDGHWVVAAADLSALALVRTGATGTPGTFNLHVTGSWVEGTSTAQTAGDLTVTITPSASQQLGRVVDGYIAGATVFADANGNGILDGNEVSTTTNADGSFTLNGGSGPLVMFGGIDISTGLPFQGTLKAPEGSTVVTPLTTLVAALVESGQTTDDAQAAVKTALGLADVDLTTYDAVASVASNDPVAATVLAAAVQVQATVAQISAAAPTADVTSALATLVTSAAQTNTPLDLTATSTVSSIGSSVGLTGDALTAVTQVVADSNATVAAATSAGDATAILTGIAQAASVALNDTTQAIATTNLADAGSLQSLTDNHSGDALTTQVASAPVGVVTPPIVGTISADTLVGTSGDDALAGLEGNDTLNGGAGNDVLDGGLGVDLASYSNATGGISVNLGAGTVDGDASVGHDTLVSIERVLGTNSADSYNASTFNAAVQPQPGVPTNQNEFEGLGGDDQVTGNGNTRISYLSATARVTVDIAAGTGHGTDGGDIAGVGNDTFTGVSSIRGSNFDDTLLGSNNGSAAFENFEGRGGVDFIDGRGGLDRAIYGNDPATTSGISVNLAAGSVIGDGSIGTDTLRSVEAIRGTNFADSYDATNFSGSSTNAGSLGTFNEFEGMGGTDTVTGNGATRVSYLSATAGVTVDLAAGTAQGTAPGDLAGIGIDTFTGPNVGNFAHGINAVRGSTFDDTLLGSNNATGTEIFEGWGGNDTIDGRGGSDLVRYDTTSPGQPFGAFGINVNMAAGTVQGAFDAPNHIDPTADALVGHDTLRSIEAIRGTNSADTYVATGFTGDGAGSPSANAGSNNSSVNEFEGMGGNDTITGNGNTRVSYANALAGVTVNLATGTAFGTDPNSANPDPLDAAGVGVDTIVSGVTRVRGSSFNDNITGSTGNDVLQGGLGNDTIIGGTGVDIAVLSGLRSAYTLNTPGQVVGPDGTDLFPNNDVELLQFDDSFMITPGFAGSVNLVGFNLPNGNPLFGRSVNDTLIISSNMNGRSIDLLGGTDTLNLNGTNGNSFNLTLSNIENLNGTAGNDTLTLPNSANGMTIDLQGGVDTINLPSTNGSTVTVRNAETINGGTGNDTVTAFLDPNQSNQNINLGLGTNVLNLAGSNTSFTIQVAGANMTVNDQTANATEQLTVTNQQFATTFNLGAGTDTLNLTSAGGNNVTVQNVEFVNGGAGTDLLTLADGGNNVTVQNIESVHGGNGSDFVTMGAAGSLAVNNVDVVTGSGGNDTVTLSADPGVTSVTSSFDLGAGTDQLILNVFGTPALNLALTNVESVSSTGGIETVNLANAANGMSIDLGTGFDTLNLGAGNNVVTVSNVEFLNAFGSGNDTVTFTPTANITNQSVNLGAGTDQLTLGGTNENLNMSISGGSLTVHDQTATGNLDLNLLNMQAATTYDLGAGTDTLHLNWDGDPNHFNVVSVQNVETVIGSGNSDQIHILGNSSGITSVTGAGGPDMMWASPNEDHFVYNSTGDSPAVLTGRDTINGFDAGQDIFDLRGLNVTSWTATDQGGQTVVDVFTNGHVTADMEIGLVGLIGTLTNSNFLLS